MSVKTLVLPEDFNQSVLSYWHEQITALFKAKQTFALDASSVCRVDCASVQFLIAVQQSAGSDSDVLSNASEHLLLAMSKLGLSNGLYPAAASQYGNVKTE
ncbi:MAG: STAS domain-containing protein [Granulosicoccaceae bacterium]